MANVQDGDPSAGRQVRAAWHFLVSPNDTWRRTNLDLVYKDAII